MFDTFKESRGQCDWSHLSESIVTQFLEEEREVGGELGQWPSMTFPICHLISPYNLGGRTSKIK